MHKNEDLEKVRQILEDSGLYQWVVVKQAAGQLVIEASDDSGVHYVTIR